MYKGGAWTTGVTTLAGYVRSFNNSNPTQFCHGWREKKEKFVERGSSVNNDASECHDALLRDFCFY